MAYTVGSCTPNIAWGNVLAQTFTYFIGMPRLAISADESNGDCPFLSTFTLASELSLTPIAETHTSATFSEIKSPVDLSKNYEKEDGGYLKVFTTDLADAQTIQLKFRILDYFSMTESDVSLSVVITPGSCTCGF